MQELNEMRGGADEEDRSDEVRLLEEIRDLLSRRA